MWFKKETNSQNNVSGTAPQLPEFPEFPELNPSLPTLPGMQPSMRQPPVEQVKEELPLLPSLPNSETANRYGREAIKAELGNEMMLKPFTKELAPEQKAEAIDKRVHEIYPQRTDKTEPIFVRIDRFQSSLKNFQEVRRQLQQIEGYLSEIKSIKSKEDQEIMTWEKELGEIKSKLESIDSNLFSKLEK